jgi:hypothetical protein
LVLVLGACETDPATNVTQTEATLNAKGKCYKGLNGWSRFQLRDATAGGSFFGVGDRYTYNCGSDTGYVQFDGRRIGGLSPGRGYEFRLRTELNNGQQFWTDSVGTQGGTNYDSFITQVETVVASDEHPAEQYLSAAPDGEAIASGCKVKEIKNIRKAHSVVGIHLWTIELRTAWKYCSGGMITKMYPAYASCQTTAAGASLGWACLDRDGVKVRAISQGGNPEHAVYTYSFRLERSTIFKGVRIVLASTKWCASNYVSGSGAHYRNGRCDIVPWGT